MSFSSDLLKWYDANARSLPWRGEKDPYRVWLSEIMLQQTQTETVKGYYARFLARFPDVHSLADAPEEEVLKLWEGLGYYSRARNLHAAAKRVSREMDGVFPQDSAGLRALPGVGPYAANAIASIAYGEPAPALDGNQARVLSRTLAWEQTLRTPFDLLVPALNLLDPARPGDYNQALMDLGATICTAKSPKCERCPVAHHCRAREADAALDFPRKSAPIAKKEQDWTILLVYCDGKLLTRRRPRGLLGGLYEFVALEGHYEPEELLEALNRQGFHNPRDLQPLPDSRHIFTHLIWHMQGWRLECDGFPPQYTAIDRPQFETLPFPSALKTYTALAFEKTDP